MRLLLCSLASLFALLASALTGSLPVQANVFSDDPQVVHDPRHAQPQTGAGKMFAPIGLIVTNRPVPDDESATPVMHYHAGTAFLVSPCYVLTAYHVVLGNRRTTRPDPNQDHSATFRVAGMKARAAPVRYGDVYMFHGRDWVLLRLDSDADHPCLGENPDIGWTELAPLPAADAKQAIVSIAGYPSDKPAAILWRQDVCRLYEKSGNIEDDGMWKTDCATLPRVSGAPIFFIRNDVLRVVALMSGHVGNETSEVLPQWDPNRANLALDIGKIVASDPGVMELINQDIARFGQPNPAQTLQPGVPLQQLPQ